MYISMLCLQIYIGLKFFKPLLINFYYFLFVSDYDYQHEAMFNKN